MTSFGIAQNVLGRIKLDPVGMCKRVGERRAGGPTSSLWKNVQSRN